MWHGEEVKSSQSADYSRDYEAVVQLTFVFTAVEFLQLYTRQNSMFAIGIPLLTMLLAQLAAGITPPDACAARMNAFCNSDPKMTGCIAQVKTQGGQVPLVALFDGSSGDDTPQWRCYSPSCLDASRTRYVRGSYAKGCAEYCTEQASLTALLSACTCAAKSSRDIEPSRSTTNKDGRSAI